MPHGRLSASFLFSTAFVAAVFLTSCGSSDPVIVSGTIEPHGPAVWARVHGEPYIGDIAAQETTNGEFELRGEVPADQARTLTLLVEQAGYAIFYCGAAVKLPPLRLSGERWVNARTGEPVVLRIKLREETNPGAPTYAERCPEDDSVSGTETSDG